MSSAKADMRRQVLARRDALTGRGALSAAIGRNLLAQPCYRSAETVMVYLSCRSEVETAAIVAAARADGKKLAIPYCARDDGGRPYLGLWRLTDSAELAEGTWGIPEPPRARWNEPGKAVSPLQPDLIVAPGVAFDRNGGRLGYGAGYYDRLLAGVRPDAAVVGVCFEAQLVEAVETAGHDIAVDWVITERACYPGRGRAALG